jgi:hypothetical protein
MDLEVFPDRSLASCVINGVGTTKWFLLPVSTWYKFTEDKGIEQQ